MLDPAHSMLTDAAIRRSDNGRHLRAAELSAARNSVLGVGPGYDGIASPHAVMRNMKPGQPELNDALAQLADPGYRSRVVTARRTP